MNPRCVTLPAVLIGAALVLGACRDEPPDVDLDYELFVDVDVKPDADLSAYESFDIIEPREIVEDPIPYTFEEVEPELRDSIIAALEDKGLRVDTESPDVVVNPLIRVHEFEARQTLYSDFYGWYWGYEHLWAYRSELTVGSLVLDLVDPGELEDTDDDVLIYRGVAVGLMAEDLDVIELELRNAVHAIFAEWPESEED